MVAWMSLLRFYAIKNTIAAICVKPLSRRLTVVCRKSKYLLQIGCQLVNELPLITIDCKIYFSKRKCPK